MDEFSHDLQFLIIELVDEKILANSIMEGCLKQLVIHLVYSQGFPIEMSDEGS